MESFKQIAEDCLAGKLSGTFILQDGSEVKSKYLRKLPPATSSICSYGLYEWYISDNGNAYGDTGYIYRSSIKRFIPDNIQEQIKIDVPEGKVPVMERTEKGVFITWKEKELTYTELLNKFRNNLECIHVNLINSSSQAFHKKVEVLRKLTNIRNYFGKPKHNTYGHALYYTIEQGIHTTPALYPSNDQRVIFDTQEHAKQAIKMLGDELKYLFEPW